MAKLWARGGLALVMALGATAALADPPDGGHCRELRGTISTHATTEGCTSALGCYAGELTTNSPLRGDTFFTVSSIQPNADGTLHYTGVLTVTLANGTTVAFQSEGTLNPATGQYTETDLAAYDAGSATLTSSGTTSAALDAFTGVVGGQLCGPSPTRK